MSELFLHEKIRTLESHSLVRLLALRSPGAGSAVVSLNDEGVLLLRLAVHQATGPQLALARRSVQHHRLERRFQPLDVERTDLPYRGGRREGWRRQETGGRSKLITQTEEFGNDFCCWWDLEPTLGSSEWIRLPVLLVWK